MSKVMSEHIRHLQERLEKAEAEVRETRALANNAFERLRQAEFYKGTAERERDAALAALRPFADMYRTYHQRGLPLPHIDADHFARAAELVPPTSAPPQPTADPAGPAQP